MQDITPNVTATAQVIQSYGPAGFRVAGVDYTKTVLITVDKTTELTASELTQLTIHDFERLWDQHPPLEVILIGTGRGHHMLDPELRAAIKAKGVGVDAMATGAAARTFNVLLSEERRVAALLLLAL